MPGLLDPIDLRGRTLRNRIGVSPMCQYAAFAEDGLPTDWHLVHLGQFAVGGAGLVIAEAAAVVPEGRISRRDVGIWSDAHVDAWRPVTAFLRAHGAVAGIQLAHAGRKASTYAPWGEDGRGSVAVADRGWETVAPSALAFGRYAAPRALDADELPGVVHAFAEAARRAVAAGFELVEVHAAHGYLLHQFLSPLANRRDDAYGGSFENRTRLPLEVAAAVREAVGPDIPVVVRISATDWVEGGWDLPQSIAFSGLLREVGVDLVDVSSGGLDPAQEIVLGPGYQVPFAADVRTGAGIPTAAVGLVTTPTEAAAIIRDEAADLVLLGREMLRDPQFALRAARELDPSGATAARWWPGQYDRARPVA